MLESVGSPDAEGIELSSRIKTRTSQARWIGAR
jgi:hypothetical protein